MTNYLSILAWKYNVLGYLSMYKEDFTVWDVFHFAEADKDDYIVFFCRETGTEFLNITKMLENQDQNPLFYIRMYMKHNHKYFICYKGEITAYYQDKYFLRDIYKVLNPHTYICERCEYVQEFDTEKYEEMCFCPSCGNTLDFTYLYNPAKILLEPDFSQ